MGQLGLNQETVILAWDERGRILRSRKKKLAGNSSRYFISYSWSKREERGRENHPTCESVTGLLTFQRSVTGNGSQESFRFLAHR